MIPAGVQSRFPAQPPLLEWPGVPGSLQLPSLPAPVQVLLLDLDHLGLLPPTPLIHLNLVLVVLDNDRQVLLLLLLSGMR